jgi:hypothetical protein
VLLGDVAAGAVLEFRRGGYDFPMTKAELIEQVESMTEEEAAQVKLIYAPDWPSKATSIEEIRKRVGTRAMTVEESQEFWSEHESLMQPADGEG